MLENDVGGGARALLSPEFNSAVGGTAREISRQSVLGARAAITEIRPEGISGILASAFESGWAVALALGALLLALTIGLVVVYARWRRDRAEAHRREDAVVSLAKAIKSMEERPWSPELKQELRAHLRDREGADYVREVLRNDPSLRLDQPRPPSRPA